MRFFCCSDICEGQASPAPPPLQPTWPDLLLYFSGYVLPDHFKSTEGRVKKPIISKRFQPVGQFTIDYLVIRSGH